MIKVDFKTSGGTVTKWIEYAYDPFNRLVRRTIDPDGPGGASATDQFFAGYDGIHATLEFDGDEDSDVSHRYLWGVGFDMLLADEQVSSVSSAGNVLWPLADHLGTIRDIADYDEGDPDFAITNHRVYDSFGRLESETNSAVDLSFGFTGKYTDDATGHTHHLHRWYDPSTGRWLSEDPMGFAAGDTNLSRYVGNKPIHSTDPLGLFEAGAGYDGFASLAADLAGRAATKPKEPILRVVISGFGPFGGRGENATKDIANRIKELVGGDGVDVIIIDVHWSEPDRVLTDAVRQVQLDGAKIDIWIGLGEGEIGKFEIEITGRNRRSPIGDEAGRTPGLNGFPMVNDRGKEASHSTPLNPPDGFLESVNGLMGGHLGVDVGPLFPDDDAGRFVCENLVYVLANAVTNGDISAGVFIHIPPGLGSTPDDTVDDALVEAIACYIAGSYGDRSR